MFLCDRDSATSHGSRLGWSAGRLAVFLLVPILTHSSPLSALVVIDLFENTNLQSAQPNNEMSATVVGGFRDVKSNNADNTASAGQGRFRCSGTAAFQGCTIQYDGQDGDPDSFTEGGFAAVDFTAGGHDRILVSTFVDAGTCNFFIEACDDDTIPQCESLSFGNIADNGSITVRFSDFAAGLDFSAITALQVNLTPTSAPVDCSVGPLQTSPLFQDGFESGNTSAWSTSVP